MLREAGTPERLSDEGIQLGIWKDLPDDEVLNVMGGRRSILVASWGAVYKSRSDMSVWSKKAFFYTVAASEMGGGSSSKAAKLASDLAARSASGSAALPGEAIGTTTLKSGEKECRIRTVAENHESNRVTQGITLAGASEVMAWHGLQKSSASHLGLSGCIRDRPARW